MIDTQAFLGGHAIALKTTRPGTYKAKCPWCQHERRKGRRDSPLTVTIRNDGFCVVKCHHCERTEHTPVSRREKRPVVRPVWTRTVADRHPIPWLEERGISPAIIFAYDIAVVSEWMPQTQAEERCIAFPYHVLGEVVNVKYRSKDKHFKQVKDAEKVFYGYDDLCGDEAIIVEGEIDKLSLAEAGYLNCVSVPNGAASAEAKNGPIDPERDEAFAYLRHAQDRMAGMASIILAVDNDPKGRALEAELARRIGRHRCKRVLWPEGVKDANEALLKLGKQGLAELIQAAEHYPIKGLYRERDFHSQAIDFVDGVSYEGVRTGWDKLDAFCQLMPGALVVITGCPGMGKSTFVDHLAVNMAEAHGWHTALCSFETPPPIHAANLIAQRQRMSWRGMARDVLEDGAAWVDENFVWLIADDESPTVDWIIEMAEAAVYRYGIKALVVDPYNEIEHKRPREQNETEYVSAILAKLKRFAQAYDVTVFLVAHPTKPREQGETPMPRLYDIAGSANFANKADYGLVIHRDGDETIVALRKIRWGWLGQPDQCTLFFDRRTGRFCERADEAREPAMRDETPEYERVRPDLIWESPLL